MRVLDRVRSPVIVVTGLCLLAFGLRVARLDFHPIWFDEDLAYQRATAALDISLASMAGSPFYYILLRGWVELAGGSLFALRYLSAFFGALTIPLLYRCVRRLLAPVGRLPIYEDVSAAGRLALATTALAVAAPFYVYYAQEARAYTLTLALMLLSMYAFLRWLNTRQGWALLVCSLANLVCLYTHYVAGLVIVAQGVMLLLVCPFPWKDLPAFVAAQAMAGLAFLPWLWRVWRLLPRVVAPLDSTTLDAWSVLARSWTEFSVGRTLLPPLSLYLAMVPLFLALAGLLSVIGDGWAEIGGRRSEVRGRKLEVGGRTPKGRGDSSQRTTSGSRFSMVVLLVWLIVPIVGSLLVPRASVRFSPKYLIAVTPVYYTLIVLGLAALRKESRALFWIGVTLLMCVSLYALGDYYFRPHDKLAQIQRGLAVFSHPRVAILPASRIRSMDFSDSVISMPQTLDGCAGVVYNARLTARKLPPAGFTSASGRFPQRVTPTHDKLIPTPSVVLPIRTSKSHGMSRFEPIPSSKCQ